MIGVGDVLFCFVCGAFFIVPVVFALITEAGLIHHVKLRLQIGGEEEDKKAGLQHRFRGVSDCRKEKRWKEKRRA